MDTTVTVNKDNRVTQGHFLTGGILLLWFAGTVVLAYNNALISETTGQPIGFVLSFMVSFSIFTLAYLQSKAVREYLLSLDMRFLIMLHSWRMLGMGFMMLYLVDQLPTLFAYLAGLGDALAAMMAVFIVFSMIKNKQGVSKRQIFRWNTFGLIDFIVAVSIGLMSRSDAILAQSNGISSDAMMTFPLAIIPVFLVQVYALIHFIIYLQLKNNHGRDSYIKIE